ncbi:MAG TPA: hypothetical protein VF792_01225 [Ktedonobacterales bacterium]
MPGVQASAPSCGVIDALPTLEALPDLPASNAESIPNVNRWTNPYRYGGSGGAGYDTSTGPYWLSASTYDPTPGRFLLCDLLGCAPLFVGGVT